MAGKFQRKTTQTWFGLFRHHGGWAACLGAAVLIVLTAISVIFYLRDQSLVDRAIPVQAEVLELDRMDLFRQDGATVLLRIDGPAGAFEHDMPVDWTFYTKHTQGSAVRLFYVPDAPPRLMWALPDPLARGWAYQLAAGFVGIMTLGFGGFAAVRTTDAIRARRYGPITKAKVLHKEVVKRLAWERLLFERETLDFFGISNETDMSRLVFRDQKGRRCRSLPHHNGQLRSIETGDEIDVYLGVHRSWWVGDLGPRRSHDSDLPQVRHRRQRLG